MGQAIIGAAAGTSGHAVMVAAALVRPGSALEGTPISGPQSNGPPLDYSAALDPDAGVAVLVDFSHAGSFAAAVALAVTHGLGLVSGTTGLEPRDEALLDDAARKIPVLWAANFSLGVALLEHLSEVAAAKLGPDFDAEILEIHHSRKRDAPSGTALALGRAVAAGRGRYLDELARFQRHGQVGPRTSGEIGFAVLRGGDSVGEHTVMFAGEGERIELTHRATDRAVFALGALRAARWLAGRPAGRYRLADIFE
jgi:4-hydroxy-tetrahydrodipicolinate reductase